MSSARRIAIILVVCCALALGEFGSNRLLVHAAPEFALQFDGVDDRVTFGTAAGLGAQNFTLELWFMRTGPGVAAGTGTGGLTSAVPLLTKGTAQADGSNLDMNYFLGIDATRRVLAADFEDMATGGNHPVLGKTSICDNIWYHAAATYDGTTWRLYLNGDLELEQTIGTAGQYVPRFDSIQHGALASALTSTGAAASFFKGQIDEARIWNVARSQAAIQSTLHQALPLAQTNLIGRWGLDEGSGTTAVNSAGAPNGTLAQGPVWVAGGSTYTSGLVPGLDGLRLSGTAANADYVTFGAATGTLGAAKFTLETWFKRESAGITTTTGSGGLATAVPLVTKGRSETEASNVDMNYFLGINVNGATSVLAADFEEGATGATPGLNHPVLGTTPIVLNTWYHAAVTYDGDKLQLYLNGVPDGPAVIAGQPPRSDSIQHAALGTALNSTGVTSGFFAGVLDEARIWNYGRTPQQIAAAAGREIPNATGLLARWSFNDCCGRVVDSTGHLPYGILQGLGWSWVARGTATPLSTTPDLAPTVLAGPAQSVLLPAAASLNGSVVDTDGVNTGTPLSSLWTKVSGPGTVTFGTASSPITTANFSVAGAYVLMLTGSDGELSASATVAIDVTSGPVNLPPTVNAGPDQTITFPAAASLFGTYSDDGMPGVDVDTAWSVVTGPGTVAIAQSQELATTATFSSPGAYQLRLTANDGALSGSDTVTITVSPASSSTALDLNGTTGFVALGQAPGLGASTFTLEAWFKREGAGIATSTGTGGIVAVPIVTKGMAQSDGSNLDMNYFLGIRQSDNVLAADFEDTNSGLNHPVAGHTVIASDGAWHHAAVTYNGTTWRLYLDGALETQLAVGNFTPRFDSIQHAAIGSALGSTGVATSGQTQGFFNGVIDEVRIWNIARSDTEIASGMSMEIPSAPNLAGRWGFNEGAGASVADGSGQGINGTINGTTAWVPGAPFSASSNHAPAQPVINGPGPSGVAAPATLDVTVSDQDNDPLTVTYYARPKLPTAPDFTYVTIPDTQHYVDNTTFPVSFTLQTNWIVANRDAMNIAFVSHLGDVTEHQDAAEIEWQRANTSMLVLDTNSIPYGVSPGNHDQSNTGVANLYDQYFPVTRFLGLPWYAGYLGAEADDPINRLNKNNYELFSVGGLDFLVIHIEMDWPDYAVTWADKIIKRYPNRRVILSTHLFLNTSNARPSAAQFRANGTSAEAVWQQIIKPNCNVFMVVNGHYPGEGRRTDLNNCGQPVHQVLMDYQSRANGGDGWLRYFAFKPSENKIYAYTYSVTQHAFEADDSSQFVLDYNMQGTSFSVVGTTSGVSSGARTTVSYGGLVPGMQYEWYATVSDGKTTTTGPVSTFTAAAPNTAPVAAGDAYSVNEDATLAVPAPGVLGNDTDAQGDPMTAALVSGPAHGALSLNADGSFTYTPSANYSGSDSFSYRANDGAADSGVATVAIMVNAVNDAPVATGDSYSTDEDTALTIAAGGGVLGNDTDVDGAGLHAILVSGPAHGTLSLNGDGSFTYTPSADYNGSDSFSYRANDGSADSNVATVAIAVNPVNDAPAAAGDSYSTNEDTALTIAAAGVLGNDTDVEGGSLTAALVSGPAHGTLSLNADGSFTYTPSADYNGPDGFTYRANDGEADSNVATVAITVQPVNDAPTAAADSYSTDEDAPLTIAAAGVLGNDTDAEGGTLTAVMVSGPAHGTLSLNADGSFIYTPSADYNGPDSFTYRANDGDADSNVATVTIAVKAVNDAPVAVDDSYSTDEDAPLTVAAAGVVGNDTDVDGGALHAVLVSGPAHGTLSLNGDGSFTYTPSADYNGPDSFTYRANDGDADSNVATVTIAVKAVNDAPVAVADSYSTDEDAPLTVAAAGVLGNDTDADGNSLKAVLVTGPAHGTLTLNTNGSFTYIPTADYNGPDSFTYRANDGDADSNVATVAIAVKPVNDPPVAVNDSYGTDEDTPLAIAAAGVLGNDSDLEGSSLKAVLVSGPANGTLALNIDGSFNYTPAAGYFGSDTFTYRAGDGSSESNLATVTILVRPVNDPPLAANDSYSTGEDTPITVAAAAGVLGNDTDAEGTPLQAILVDPPAHGTVTLNPNGSFVYTPLADFTGIDSFTYRASDGAAQSNEAMAVITVAPVNDAPVAYSSQASTQMDRSLAITVLAHDEEGSPLTYRIVSGPAHGTLSGTGPAFTYTPARRFTGADSFTFVANDGQADSAPAIVSLTVTATKNQKPVAYDQRVDLDEDTKEKFTLTANDPDGDVIHYRIIRGPRHGSLSGEGAQLKYTPDRNFNGRDWIVFQAYDRKSESNLAVVTFVVAPVNDAPQALDLRVVGLNDRPLTGRLAGRDVDGDRLRFRLVDEPSRGTVTINAVTGVFTYTPDRRHPGQRDTFEFVVNDGQTDSRPATVRVDLRQPWKDR